MCNLVPEYLDDKEKRSSLFVHRCMQHLCHNIRCVHIFVSQQVSTAAKDIALDPTTVSYTYLLLKTASGEVEGIKDPGKFGIPSEKTKLPAYILGIIAPSIRLSALLAMELKGVFDPNSGTDCYKDWIDYHSSVSFQVVYFFLFGPLSCSISSHFFFYMSKHSLNLNFRNQLTNLNACWIH